MRKKYFGLLIFVVLITTALVSLTGCGAKSTATNAPKVNESVSDKPLVKIRLANLAVGISYMPQQLAIEKGIFAKHGIDLQVVNFTQGGAAAIAGVASGGIDIGEFGTPIITGITKGIPIKIVASPPDKRMNFVLVATNDIKTVQDLKGKTVATGALGGGVHQSFLKILAGNGVKESDVKVMATGGTDAYMILTSGKVAAVETSLDTAIRAEKAGTGHLLANAKDYYQNYQHTYVFATNKLIETNPEAIRNYLAASREGYEYAQSHQDELVAYTIKTINMDEGLVREYWKQIIPIWDLSFKVDVEGTGGALKVLQELKEVDSSVKFEPDKWIDLSFAGKWEKPNQ